MCSPHTSNSLHKASFELLTPVKSWDASLDLPHPASFCFIRQDASPAWPGTYWIAQASLKPFQSSHLRLPRAGIAGMRQHQQVC